MARTEGPAPRKKHTRLEWALWIGSFAVVGALLYFPLFSSPLPPHDGYIALFLANLLGSLPIVLTGPGQFATFAAGSLYNPILAGLAAGSGALLGDSVGYILGRLGRVTLPASTPAGALSFIERIRTSGSSSRTFWVLFVLALTPNPFFDFVALGCGIAQIGAIRYFVPTALGKLLRFLLWALVGAGFNVSSEMVLAAAPILAVPATAALLAVISWWFLSSATGERQGLLMHFSLFAAVAHLELLTHMAIRDHPVVYGLILAGLLAGLGLQVWVYKHQRELTHQRYMEVLRGRAQDGPGSVDDFLVPHLIRVAEKPACQFVSPRSTLLDIEPLLDRTDDTFRKRLLQHLPDEEARHFWESVYPAYPKDAHLAILNRLGRLLKPKVVRSLLCSPGGGVQRHRLRSTSEAHGS